MNFEAQTTNGVTINPGNPLAFCISKSSDIPADSLTCLFAISEPHKFKKICVYENFTDCQHPQTPSFAPETAEERQYKNPDHKLNLFATPPHEAYPISDFQNNELNFKPSFSSKKQKHLIFSGFVDEQSYLESAAGSFLKITARSLAALLLDNEAHPQIYSHPCLDTLFRKHLAPYGVTSFLGSNRIFHREFHVHKGMSEWAVLEKFCENYLNVSPRLHSNGIFDATVSKNHKNFSPSQNSNLTENSQSLHFSNKYSGIRYTSIQKYYKRHHILSDIFIRTGRSSDYSIHLKDEHSREENITKKRYIDSFDTENSAILGEVMLSSSRNKSQEIIITSPGYIKAEIFEQASLNSPKFGKINNLIVHGIKYKRDMRSEFSQFRLKPSINQN
ncbi:MAG: hypothetical protein LBJ95_05060 [Oscillospiraceae bacterium]|nr:hypothetical protein [Oscillospiraceae bacterium]